jgi:hypothetical protein
MGIPGVERLIDELETLPNSTLEDAYRQGAVGGIKRFGVRKPLNKDMLELLAIELNERRENGIYIYSSNAERLRLKPINIKDPAVDPLNADV